MSALPGSPAIQNTIPMPFFGTTPFAAPGLGLIAAAIMLGIGLWWLGRAEGLARKSGEGYAGEATNAVSADDQFIRERATSSHEFDTAEIGHGKRSETLAPIGSAITPLVVVVVMNLLMSLVILPRLDFAFLAEPRWGATSLPAVAGVWLVAVALAAATVTLIVLNRNSAALGQRGEKRERPRNNAAMPLDGLFSDHGGALCPGAARRRRAKEDQERDACCTRSRRGRFPDPHAGDRQTQPRFVLFVAQDDIALKLSGSLRGGTTRLGQVNPDQEPYRTSFRRERIEVFDLTGMRGLAHSRAFREIDSVVAMLEDRFAQGQSMAENTLPSDRPADQRTQEPASPGR